MGDLADAVITNLDAVKVAHKLLMEIAQAEIEEIDMRKTTDPSVAVQLANIDKSLVKLRRQMEWLTAAVVASGGSNLDEAISKTNRAAHNPRLSDGGPRSE